MENTRQIDKNPTTSLRYRRAAMVRNKANNRFAREQRDFILKFYGMRAGVINSLSVNPEWD